MHRLRAIGFAVGAFLFAAAAPAGQTSIAIPDDIALATVSALSDPLPELVVELEATKTPNRQQECLAQAVYFESRGEPLQGQLAVAEVILNRAASGKYPRNLCEVIRQKAQFSFVRDGRIPVAPKDRAWRKAVAIADIAVRDLAESPGAGAMFFHATYVAPVWRHSMDKVGQIGGHIFYR